MSTWALDVDQSIFLAYLKRLSCTDAVKICVNSMLRHSLEPNFALCPEAVAQQETTSFCVSMLAEICGHLEMVPKDAKRALALLHAALIPAHGEVRSCVASAFVSLRENSYAVFRVSLLERWSQKYSSSISSSPYL